jgi:hypothetical protein
VLVLGEMREQRRVQHSGLGHFGFVVVDRNATTLVFVVPAVCLFPSWFFLFCEISIK